MASSAQSASHLRSQTCHFYLRVSFKAHFPPSPPPDTRLRVACPQVPLFPLASLQSVVHNRHCHLFKKNQVTSLPCPSPIHPAPITRAPRFSSLPQGLTRASLLFLPLHSPPSVPISKPSNLSTSEGWEPLCHSVTPPDRCFLAMYRKFQARPALNSVRAGVRVLPASSVWLWSANVYSRSPQAPSSSLRGQR